MDRGYVKIWRKIKDESWYRKPLIAHLAQHLVREASHKDHKIIWNKAEMVIKRGQLLTSQFNLAAETGLSRKNVRTALFILAKCQFVAIRTAKRYSIITICNYDRYQDKQIVNGQVNGQPNSEEVAKWGPSGGHIQECKECKEEKKGSEQKKVRTRSPKEFTEESEAYKLANHHLTRILELSPNIKKPSLQSWAQDVDYMLRLDGRKPDEIRNLLDRIFTGSDSIALFWRKNILSPGALRKKKEGIQTFDRILIQMGETKSSKGKDDNDGFY